MTQRNLGPSIQIGCGCLLLFALLLGTVIALLGKNEADHFWDNGIHVEGVITSIDPELQYSRYRTRKTIVSETVHFWYPVGEQRFRHYQRFAYDTSFYEGQHVSVIYLPDTPWTAEIQMNTTAEDYSFIGVLLFGPCITAMIGSYLYDRYISRNRQKRKPREEAIL